jgi:uncharacterized repeat protein (TIGR01451 family)
VRVDENMKRIQILLLAILVLISGIGIVSAIDYPFDVTKTHDVTPVNPGDEFTYIIHVTNPYNMGFEGGPITDRVPDEVEVVSCSGCCSMEDAPNILWESICQQDTEPYDDFYRTITVRLKPDTEGKTFCNSVYVNTGMAYDHSGYGTSTAEDCITVPSEPVPAPEFPSIILPTTMITGFLAAVLLIQRTRRN